MSTIKAAENDRTQDGVLLKSSTLVGGSTGLLGVFYGATYATFRSKPLVLYSVFFGGQWFVLGGSFWFTRSMFRAQAGRYRELTRMEDLMYSSAAGACAGAISGSLRGRPYIIPGAMVKGLMGLAGEAVAPTLVQWASGPADGRPILSRLSDSKWWPLKQIPDADYEKSLSEKVIALDAQIQIIDEKLLALRRELATEPPKT